MIDREAVYRKVMVWSDGHVIDSIIGFIPLAHLFMHQSSTAMSSSPVPSCQRAFFTCEGLL